MSDELESLLDQLADAERPIRTIDLAALSDLPRGQATTFSNAWADLDATRRLELITAMVEQAETNIHLNFHTILRECTKDADSEVRRLAVEGLWEDDRISLVTMLVNLLAEDPTATVRAAAANSLGRFVLMGVLGEIAETCALQAENALHAAWFRPMEDLEVRRRALEGLAYTDLPHIHELIDIAYYDENSLMRQSAIFAMGRTADRRWGRFVLDELFSRDAAMRFEAAMAAGELELQAAVRPLIHLLEDADSNVREAAALALGKIGGREAKRALEMVLDGDDEHLADAAEDALEELTFNSGSFDEVLMDVGGRAVEVLEDSLLEYEDDQDYYDADLDDYDYGTARFLDAWDPFVDAGEYDWDDDDLDLP